MFLYGKFWPPNTFLGFIIANGIPTIIASQSPCNKQNHLACRLHFNQHKKLMQQQTASIFYRIKPMQCISLLWEAALRPEEQVGFYRESGTYASITPILLRYLSLLLSSLSLLGWFILYPKIYIFITKSISSQLQHYF